MPAEFDKCVRGMMSNPDFKPKEGKSKKDSAYAICTTQYQKRHKGKNPTSAAYMYMDSPMDYSATADQRFLHEAIQNAEMNVNSYSYYEGQLKDDRTKALLEDIVNYNQLLVAKLAVLRLDIDPNAESASQETLAQLMDNDPELRLAVRLLELDKEFWDKYGND